MKEKLLDISNVFKNNRATFYKVVLFIFVLFMVCLVVISNLRPEKESKEVSNVGQEFSINGDVITYINSYYDKEKELIEVHLGVNGIKSIFDEDNLKAELITQVNNTERKVIVKKVTPQLIVVRADKISSNYFLARLTLKYKDPNSDSINETQFYFRNSKNFSKTFSKKNYRDISLDFKRKFVQSDINKIQNKIDGIEKQKEKLKSTINDLKSDTSLYTKSEKEQVETNIESMKVQIESLDDQIKVLNDDLLDRYNQKSELESISKK